MLLRTEKIVADAWGITRQVLSKDAHTGFLTRVPSEGRNVREQPVRCIFPLACGTFYFPNGLRSDRNTARHAESPRVEGLQCVLWAPESLICMKVHRTISPCNTLPRRKNQCPRAHKDEYRAFQLSFFFLKIFLFSNGFKRQYDTVFIFR